MYRLFSHTKKITLIYRIRGELFFWFHTLSLSPPLLSRDPRVLVLRAESLLSPPDSLLSFVRELLPVLSSELYFEYSQQLYGGFSLLSSFTSLLVLFFFYYCFFLSFFFSFSSLLVSFSLPSWSPHSLSLQDATYVSSRLANSSFPKERSLIRIHCQHPSSPTLVSEIRTRKRFGYYSAVSMHAVLPGICPNTLPAIYAELSPPPFVPNQPEFWDPPTNLVTSSAKIVGERKSKGCTAWDLGFRCVDRSNHVASRTIVQCMCQRVCENVFGNKCECINLLPVEFSLKNILFSAQ